MISTGMEKPKQNDYTESASISNKHLKGMPTDTKIIHRILTMKRMGIHIVPHSR